MEILVQVAIFNSQNEMLIQKRQSNLEKYPNLWDISASGYVMYNESSQEAIENYVYEQLGYSYNFDDEIPYFTINTEKESIDIFILKNIDIDLEDLKIKSDEIQNIIWANKEEIIQLIEEGKFIQYSPGFIELLFFQIENRGIKK